MTTRKLSSEKLVDFSLFKNMTRRRLPHTLVAFLINFFTMSVAFMLTLSQSAEWYSGLTEEMILSRTLRDVEGVMTLNLVFTYLLAVYFGVITLSYMMKRRSAHFYHALPQRRETLYFTSIASSLVCAAVGIGVNIVIAYAELHVFDVAFAEVVSTFWALLLKNILTFLLVYAITVFAGSVSGNGIVQVLMSAVILFYPLATYYAVTLTRGIFSTYFWIDRCYSENILEWLSPVTYSGFNYTEEGITLLPTALCILFTVLLMACGMLIYRRRAIENSEKPIVFVKLGQILKYMFMFTITIFAGLFFYTIGNSTLHLIFGFVSGATLSFMLFNTILEKSPKAMFKGVKGLAIFAAAFAVYSLVFCFDVFKMDEYIPSEDNISSAEIVISGVEYDDKRFDDPEILKTLVAVLENEQKADKKGAVYPAASTDAQFNVRTVMYTKLGIPILRTYGVSKYTEGAEQLLKLYADDERMQAEYDKFAECALDMIETGKATKLSIVTIGISYDLSQTDIDIAEFYRIYSEEFGKTDYDRLSKPVVASAALRGNVDGSDYFRSIYYFYQLDTFFSEFIIYADMTKTIDYLGINTDGSDNFMITDEYGNEVEYTTARIFDTRDTVFTYSGRSTSNMDKYPFVEVDSELAHKLWNEFYTYSYNGYVYPMNIFTAIDTDYVFRVTYGEDGGKDDYIVYEDTKATVESAEYYDKQLANYLEYVIFFPKGTVPEEVKALFE